jgi:hypothetical protein
MTRRNGTRGYLRFCAREEFDAVLVFRAAGFAAGRRAADALGFAAGREAGAARRVAGRRAT